MRKKIKQLFIITRSNIIARRYFVVNGFDGVLTMTGLLMGFYISQEAIVLHLVITACLSTAIALAVSGISSAYISEKAEKKQELEVLENAMISDMQSSVHGQAARLMPFFIALINGLSPLFFAIIIIAPLWIALWHPGVITYPIETAIAVALSIIFLLGVFIGHINNKFWLWAGIRALIIALSTGLIIFLVGQLL